MSTESWQETPVEVPRRPRRAVTRHANWVKALAGAQSGEEALTNAMRWTWAVLSDIEERRPQVAEAARWEIARSLAGVAARLPRERYALRPGLTEAEVQALLNPWRAQGGDSR